MLNKEQERVINELEKHILLLASAGTGKTNTLALRVGNILEKEMCKSDEILCITFTNKACKEMQERISEKVGDLAKGVVIKTFHGLCYDIIKRESKRYTDITFDFGIVDEEDTISIIENSFSSDFKPNELYNIISSIREYRLEKNIFTGNYIKDYESCVEKLMEDGNKLYPILEKHRGDKLVFEDTIREKGAEITIKYIQELRKYNKLDFFDLMEVAYDILRDNELVDRLASQFKYICVDEVQDTSILEYNIISKLFKYSKVLLSGDKMQTIYGWRGSNPIAIFEKFKEDYNPLEVVFNCNYRASKVLTDCSASFLNKAFPSEMESLYKDGISSFSEEEGEKVSFFEASNVKEEAKYIYDNILNLSEEDRKSVCILTRNNDYNVELSNELRNMGYGGLDFALIDDCKFFRKPEIKDIIAFLRLSANKYDGDAFKRILNRLSYGIGEGTISLIESAEYREYGISITDFIDERAVKDNDKYALLVDSLENNNVVVFDVESTGTDTTRDEIIQIAAIKIDKNGKEIDRFMKFLKTDKPVGDSEKVHHFSDEFLAENGEDKEKTLLEFLEFIRGTVIVGHNVQYDINILTSELSRRGLPKPTFEEFYDTLDLFRRFYPNLDNHKLEYLSAYVDTEHKPNHNALFDILATGEILVYVVNNNVIPTKMGRVNLMSKMSVKFARIAEDLNKFFKSTEDKRPKDIIATAVNGFKLKNAFAGEGVKIWNMREFYHVAALHDDESLSARDSLLDFVTITSLSNGEMEKLFLSKGRIPILTVHQVKGLEFNHVFVAGLQDGIFPSFYALKSGNIEEEKRLMYVVLTRPKVKLHLSYSKIRKGRQQKPSILLSLIDNKYIKVR